MKKVKINEVKREERLAVLKRIEENEKLGGDAFNQDVEIDPPYTTLMPNDVDYEFKKFSTKIKRFFANIIAKIGAKKVVKDFNVTVIGAENLAKVFGGAIVTANHFSIFENVAVWQAVLKAKRKGKFYRVIREGNYFMPGVIGFLLKYADTLPISSNLKTMMNLSRAIDKYLKNGDTVLVYPEKALWWNYKKPRPFLDGAFKYAVKAGVPVVPVCTTIEDLDEIDETGFSKKKYIVHVLPPIYKDENLSDKENAIFMRDKNFEMVKEKYEEFYKIPLKYGEDKTEEKTV